jgi:hypothetical protein
MSIRDLIFEIACKGTPKIVTNSILRGKEEKKRPPFRDGLSNANIK